MRNIDACLYVRPSDRTTLERLVADGKTAQKIVARARIVRGLPAAGHQDKRSSRSNKRAGASGSIFTARSISRPARPGRSKVVTVDAVSTIRLLELIAALYPMLALIHVFLDNARAGITPSWCRNGLRDPGAGSSCISSRPIARISIRSSGCGASCTETSRTTNATPHAPNSPMRRLVSCVKQCLGTGRTSVIGSPTISASSTQRIFGS